jgi:hypothetical protein
MSIRNRQNKHILYLDTGETFGIIRSKDTSLEECDLADFDLILLGDDGATAEVADDDDSELGEEDESAHRATDRRGDASGWLARMEGTKTMKKKIAGQHEKDKFWSEYQKYQTTVGKSTNWELFAEDWNLFVATRENANQNSILIYYRKEAHMLENFLESGKRNNNISATLQPHRTAIEGLTKELRAGVAAPLTSISAPGPSATHGPNSGNNIDLSNMVPTIPLHMSNASILTSQISGPLIYPCQVQQCNPLKRTISRAPAVCSICGHYSQHNAIHNTSHGSGGVQCKVPENAHSPDKSLKGWCSCPECITGAESIDHRKPDAKQKRGLKVCGTCGHYKDHGKFKQFHLDYKCQVPGVHVKDKQQSYCSCEDCRATALLMGYEKLNKIRKSA